MWVAPAGAGVTISVACSRTVRDTSIGRTRFVRTLSRKLSIVAFVVAWMTAPAFPSIVCALTVPSADASELVEMPDCHSSSTAAAGTRGDKAHRACCEDAATSCCLKALDVDGAFGGLVAHDAAPALAVVAVTTAPELPRTSLLVFGAISRAHAPPGSLFRVLRL